MRLVVLGMIAALGLPAAAECPKTAVQDAVNLWAAVSQGAATPKEDASLDALEAACRENAYVLKVTALTHGILSQRAATPDRILAQAVKARASAMRLRDVQPDNEIPVSAQVGQTWQPIRIFGDNFDRDILLVYFGAHQRSGMLDADAKPLAPGETLRACRRNDSVEAQTISTIIRQNLKSDLTGALNLLDRLIAICAARIASKQDAVLLALRARAYYQLLTDNPQRPGALKMMETLKADSKRFFELRPAGDSIYWSTYDRDRLAAFAVEFDVANGQAPARAEWFKPGNPENPVVIRAIAMALDDAWANDEPQGVAGKYQTYRSLMQALLSEANRSGNAPAAKRAIAAAAKGQSDGSMRRPANVNRKAPPDWLWDWVDASAPSH